MPSPSSMPRLRQTPASCPSRSCAARANRTALSSWSATGRGSLKNTITPSPAKCSNVPSCAGISSPRTAWYSRRTSNSSSEAAVSTKAVKPRRSQKARDVGAVSGQQLLAVLLETSSATCGETNRASSVRCRSTASIRRAFATAIAAWSANVCTSAMCSLVNGSGSRRDRTTTPIRSSSTMIGTPITDR